MNSRDTKVLFHYDAGDRLRDEVAQFREQGLDVVCCPEGPDEPFFSELAGADVLWHVLQPITAEVLARAPNLKLIQKIGVGVNTIDLETAKSRGIAVCNMPGTNSRAVAEMALMLMLAALRKQPRLSRYCRSGEWYVDQATKESLGEIGGRTVGFVGFGEIPRILAPIVQAMGARAVYTDIDRKPVPYDYLPLDSVLEQSDIVTLHIPLTPETDKLINASRLAIMKPGAVLINTARGELVDESALYAALTEGSLSAAGLDVFNEEPLPTGNPLLSLDNVVTTPHMAWLTNETFTRSLHVAVQNSLAIKNEGELVHRVI
jgi:phosphoglycerate dehydrogenase-like enzyme